MHVYFSSFSRPCRMKVKLVNNKHKSHTHELDMSKVSWVFYGHSVDYTTLFHLWRYTF